MSIHRAVLAWSAFITGGGPAVAQGGNVSRSYPVADLVMPEGKAPVNGRGVPVPLDSAGVIKRLKAVEPETWSENGGTGTVHFLPLGMSIVVERQSPNVQAKIEATIRLMCAERDPTQPFMP